MKRGAFRRPNPKRATLAVAALLTLCVLHCKPRPDPAPSHPPPPPAGPATLHALGDIAIGVPLGPYQVEGVTEPSDGAVLIRAGSAAGTVTYELRLSANKPLPAARTAKYAVYYRDSEGGADVLAGAAALAVVLDRAPPGDPPLPGLTKYVPGSTPL